MKKIITIVALATSFSFAFAQQQVKSIDAAKAAVATAREATENPKKNTKTATWMAYGKALLDAYNAPFGNGWLGATREELALVLSKEKPSSTEAVNLMGQNFTKDVYETRNYYFSPQGQLSMIEVTKPAIPDALEAAVDAYAKAAELDVKGSKTKDIIASLQLIASKHIDEAYNAYSFSNYSEASKCFEKSVAASATAPLSKIDTNSIYNAGFTAWLAGEYDRAKGFFEKSVALGYYGEGGEAFAKLADIADKAGDKKASKEYLEDAFIKFPQSQSILVGLINYYVTSGEDPDRLFSLIDGAKKNEPGNASLYYVEGTIHEKLGNLEAAVASYRKCADIDPKYEFGYIGEGILHYNRAVKIQEEAQNEMDDNKYMALVSEFENTLKACIEPFEKAIELVKDDQTKASVAEYLKNACFRFRTEDASYQEKYDKYAEMSAKK